MPNDSITRPLVLVADPDVEAAVTIARQLEWSGYGVLTTGSAEEAEELVEEWRPDALVTEATMPGASGYELVRLLREEPVNRLMPIVMISARAGKLDRDFAFTVGADEYIKKPFRAADLVGRIAYLVPPPVTVARMARPGRRLRPVPALALQ